RHIHSLRASLQPDTRRGGAHRSPRRAAGSREVNLMDGDRFEKPVWYRAIPLAERIASPPAAVAHRTAIANDEARANRRAQRWRSQGPLADDSLYAQRLAGDGLSEEQFRVFLGEPDAAVKERMPERPTWLATLARAAGDPASAQPRLVLESPEGHE